MNFEQFMSALESVAEEENKIEIINLKKEWVRIK